MEIVHGKELQFEEISLKHRGSGITFKHLFLGQENTPENYLFTISRQTKFYSPRHRHNFDQFRYAYRGDVSIAPDLTLREGELCYHPEAVFYGPQNDESGERDVLVLQFGGTSGQGYLNFAQVAEGQKLLKQSGRFEGGKFYPEGERKPQDAYEAIWERFSGRPLEYPAPRYHSVIVAKPENYAWVPCKGSGSGTRNMSTRTLGVFTERQTRADMIKLEMGGELELLEDDALQLLFVVRGQGKAGEKVIEMESAVHLLPGTRVLLSSDSQMEIIRFVLPILQKTSTVT